MLQLKLNLWNSHRRAQAVPTAIALQQLIFVFDQELKRMGLKKNLEQGLEAIAFELFKNGDRILSMWRKS